MSTSSLATIMFTDLVDSTGQRARIGDDAADAIAAAHDRIVTEAAGRHGGRVVKTLGDGALSVYSSALDAVEAGIEICGGVADHATSDRSGHTMSVRVGIHAGEVAMADDGDVSGLPVAVAARVCAVAGGGQVVMSSVVRSLLGSRGAMGLQSLGYRTLKGVPDAVELWAVAAPGADGAEDESDEPVPFPPFLARGIPAALVGRDEELARLDRAYERASEGRAVFAAIVGEPGIGKTALTASWTRRVADGGAAVVGGRCTPDAALPYQPFIEVARSVLVANPGRLADLGPAAGNVAMLVPGVPSPPGLPAPVQADADTTQYLMSEAFVKLMSPPPDQPPAVVVVDDLHWADDASVAVIAHVARLDSPLRIVLIGTYRDTDLVRSHPLPRLLSDLRRDQRVDRVVLRALGSDDVAEMVATRVGHPIDRRLVDSIAAETKGNPFFVAEMLAHLRDEGAVDDDGRWVSEIPIEDYGIPEGIRDVVGRRIERLGDDAAPFLEVAAVVGPTFPIGLVAELAELDDAAVDDLVDRAIETGLLTEGDTVDEAAFAHALVRQTIHDELTPRRRVRLHRAVAAALDGAGAPAAEVLAHWLTANDVDRALPVALSAAREARRAFAESDTTRYLELALDLWGEAHDPEAATGLTHADVVMELSNSWSDFAVSQSRGMELIDAEIASGIDDPRTLARLYARRADHLWQGGDIEGSNLWISRALEMVPRDEPSMDLAAILANQAGRRMTGGRFREAIDMAHAAYDMIIELDGPRNSAAELRAVSVLASSYGSMGDLEESERWFSEMRRISDETGSIRGRNSGFMNQGEAYRANGRFDTAMELFDQGISLSRELGLNRWEVGITANAVEVLFATGRWDEAVDRLAAVSEAPTLDFPEFALIGRHLALAAERGEDPTWDRLADRLAGCDVATQEQQVNGAIYEGTISHLRWAGRLDEAYAVAVEAMGSWADLDDLTEGAPAAAHAVGVVADAAERGSVDPAWVAEARSWADHLERSRTPEPFLGVWRAIARADLARAEGADDPDLWRAALEWTADRPYVAAVIRWRLARALRQTLAGTDADEAECDELVAAARATAERLGALPLLAALDG